ncbi:emerin (Emery-Dreifuss muscular dystrophy) isoform 1-T2 [Clarias gariepinus]|uniref:emerin (Emery-Dreifuss muscular dystrophy) n=1 Tax=Clarias gariepinus TaxID=13013 RepID=UPI00234C6D6C|nr:emerin (Emery-Dreifuss muscular dystrophy) [Clarias gariepinus]XP_053339090.1 emerin (Emery-Dreifuss muscular dystrophy) [Clarias gariepinus]
MSSLSSKTSEELCKLLDEYGINHGPIVDSTRKLYEKKLTEAMSKRPKSSSPDKTYYREEQEEITYVTYRPPTQHENTEDVTRRYGASRDADDVDNANEPIISYTRTAYQSTPRSRSTAYTSKSSLQDASPGTIKSQENKSGGVPVWLRMLVFIIIAVLLYYLYSNMESVNENPFKTIDS